MKKFFKYFGIIILSIVGLIVIGTGVLFFLNGGMSHFKSTTTTITTTETESETTTVATSTTATTTTKPQPTKPSTTKAETKTTPETTMGIDLGSLSIIDLYPLSLSGGDWDVKHCRGITVDKENEFIYYSYTTMLVKCNFDGDIVASVTGISGHLGDITYNKADKKIYCGHYSDGRTGFYCYIFDTTKITKMNMKPTEDVVRSVYIKEAYEDYLGSVTIKNGDSTKTIPHRYGCSGLDGTTMAPDFSKKDKSKEYLTLAYGIYSEPGRNDNNYRILLRYDVTDWWSKYGRKHSNTAHRVGPSNCNKYFVYTGNTMWGVQTLEYFDDLNLLVMNSYAGEKETFPKHTLFAVDLDFAPKNQALKGQPKADKQNVLTLYTEGNHDKKHEVWGYFSRYGVRGVAYMGDGLFYVCRPYKSWTGKKLAICYLNVWKKDNNGNGPFTLCVDVPNDYTIKKSKHINPTSPPTSAATQESTTKRKSLIERIFG